MDNIDGMKKMIEECIQVDSIVTDPPYFLSDKNTISTEEILRKGKVNKKGFMGKEWDGGTVDVEEGKIKVNGHFIEPEAIIKDKPIYKKKLNLYEEFNKIWLKYAYQILKPGGLLLSFSGTRTYHRLASAAEEIGFDIKDTLEWMYGCYSSDTECLTKEGWKKYNELTLEDEIMQWDSNSNELTFSKPLDIIIKPYKGKMYQFANRHTDQLITPNHRVYAKIRKHSRNPKPTEYEVVKAENIKKHWQKNLPLAGIYKGEIEVDPDYAYLVGWWLTDAWLHGDKKACMFSQSKKKTLKKLREALENYNCNLSEYIKERKKETHQDEHTFYVTGELADKLIKDYPNRKLNLDMLNWNIESRRMLVEGLMDGDGSIRKKQYAHVFWSKNKRRLDIFQLLVMSLGYRTLPDFKKGCIHFNVNTNTTQLQAKHVHKTVDYNDNVWCLKTETGAFVVRRNGKIFISGNSGFPKAYDISKGFDKKAGVERKVVGKKERSGSAYMKEQDHWQREDGKAIDGRDSEKIKKRVEKMKEEGVPVTLPATDLAKKWEGWKSPALKPAHEMILLAQKPIEGTYCDNIEKYGCGGINIDECRNGTSGARNNGRKKDSDIYGDFGSCEKVEYNKGRFPANLLLTHHPDCECIGEKKVKGAKQRDEREEVDDKALYGNSRKSGLGGYADKDGLETVGSWNCVEGCPIKALDEQSGVTFSSGGTGKATQDNDGYSSYGWKRGESWEGMGGYKDKGGASRYFNNFKWQDEDFFLYTAKASKSERTCEGNVENKHPTVKPLELIRWLIKLSTPKDGISVDLFCGSGTHPCSAYLEGINFIAFEKEKEYWEIANNRYEYYKNKPMQESLF